MINQDTLVLMENQISLTSSDKAVKPASCVLKVIHNHGIRGTNKVQKNKEILQISYIFSLYGPSLCFTNRKSQVWKDMRLVNYDIWNLNI